MGQLKQIKKEKLNFIESRLDIGQEQAVPLIGQTLEYIDQNFPKETIKLLDSPPGTSCPVIEATKDADFIILVTEPTPFGMHDLRLAIETMQSLNKEFGVVINRDGIGTNDIDNYCTENNIPILARIPNSKKLAEIYSKGELTYKKFPAFENELQKIKTYITNLKIS